MSGVCLHKVNKNAAEQIIGKVGIESSISNSKHNITVMDNQPQVHDDLCFH